MRVVVYKNTSTSKSPTGIPKAIPCFVPKAKRRRRALNSWLHKLNTPAGKDKIIAELRRRASRSLYWTRQANQHGLKAACELLLSMLDDLDLATWQTRNNLESLCERAGLNTKSAKGNISCSRGSRACDRLSWLQVIVTQKSGFNPFDKRCECKRIEVTEEFFAILGISIKQVYKERAVLLKADPVEVIHSWDSRLIERKIANWQRMDAAGLLRMKARREKARQLKANYFADIAHSP